MERGRVHRLNATWLCAEKGYVRHPFATQVNNLLSQLVILRPEFAAHFNDASFFLPARPFAPSWPVVPRVVQPKLVRVEHRLGSRDALQNRIETWHITKNHRYHCFEVFLEWIEHFCCGAKPKASLLGAI